MTELERPADMGHIADAVCVPNVGEIPAPAPPDPDPPPTRRGKQSKTSEGAEVAPSVVEGD